MQDGLLFELSLNVKQLRQSFSRCSCKVHSSTDISIRSVAQKAIHLSKYTLIDKSLKRRTIPTYRKSHGMRLMSMLADVVGCLRSSTVLHNRFQAQETSKWQRAIFDIKSHDCASWRQLAHSEINRQFLRPLLAQLLLINRVQRHACESAHELVVCRRVAHTADAMTNGPSL